MNKYQKYFSKFMEKNKGKIHFACHSHHYWPDCTEDAQNEYWQDSSTMVDDKWEYIFSKKIPKAQKLISEILKFDRPEDIAFAPNTHELVNRILSSFDGKIKILTTDSEFYSFSRQLNRLIETGLIEATIVPVLPFNSFKERFLKECLSNHDIVFFSQVFFNSGLAIESLEEMISEISKCCENIIVDGYHAFMALPVDLSRIQDKIFYIAGSYKYAGAGEGCCFMTIPKACKLRPKNTGWFAELSALDNIDETTVGYPKNGLRFAGSTLDYTSLYRLIAVLDLFKKEKIYPALIHKHVQTCQLEFLKIIDSLSHPHLNRKNLLLDNINSHGHFLSFELKSAEVVNEIRNKLLKNGIVTDSRKRRLRFGFSIYHDPKDYVKSKFLV